MERSKLISGLLSKYDTTFKLSEVEALLEEVPLPSTANPTLLDIEQSFQPLSGYWTEENLPLLILPGSSGNENVE